MSAHGSSRARTTWKGIQSEATMIPANDLGQRIGSAQIGSRKIDRIKLELNELGDVAIVIATTEMVRDTILLATAGLIGPGLILFSPLTFAVIVFIVVGIVTMIRAVIVMACHRAGVYACSGAKSVVQIAPERHVKHDGNARDF
jgi:hypothetical protein